MGIENGLRRRPVWLLVCGILILGALLLRTGMAFNGASLLQENTLGLTGVDALIISLIITVIFCIIVVRSVNSASNRLLKTVRQNFPDSPVFLTTVLPSTVETVRAAIPASRLKENTGAVVCLGEQEITWWRGARSPAKLAALTADEPIVYRRGTLEHFGRIHPALIAALVVGGRECSIPLLIISESSQSFLMKGATNDELAAIQSRLQRP